MENIVVFNIVFNVPLKEFSFTLILLFSFLHYAICSIYLFIFLTDITSVEDHEWNVTELEVVSICLVSVFVGFFNVLNLLDDFPLKTAIVNLIN